MLLRGEETLADESRGGNNSMDVLKSLADKWMLELGDRGGAVEAMVFEEESAL